MLMNLASEKRPAYNRKQLPTHRVTHAVRESDEASSGRHSVRADGSEAHSVRKGYLL